MDKSRFRYQKFLSDIAGQDVVAHRDSPRIASLRVRNWLNTVAQDNDTPGAQHIWKRFLAFNSDLPLIAKQLKLKPSALDFRDRCNVIALWLKKFGGMK